MIIWMCTPTFLNKNDNLCRLVPRPLCSATVALEYTYLFSSSFVSNTISFSTQTTNFYFLPKLKFIPISIVFCQETLFDATLNFMSTLAKFKCEIISVDKFNLACLWHQVYKLLHIWYTPGVEKEIRAREFPQKEYFLLKKGQFFQKEGIFPKKGLFF